MMQTSLAGSGPKYPALAVVWILLGVAVASAGVQDVYRLSLSTGRITTTLLAGLALVASLALCAVIAWNLHTGLRRWRTLGVMISALLAVFSGFFLPLLVIQLIRRQAHWELLALMALIFAIGIKTFLALRAQGLPMAQTSLASSGPKYPALAVVWILLGVAVASAGVQDVYRLSLSTGRITTTLLAGLALVASLALCAVIAWNLYTGLRRWRTLGVTISALLAVFSGFLLPLLVIQLIRRQAHWELLALMALIFAIGIKTFLALRAR